MKLEVESYHEMNPVFQPSWDRPERYVVIMGGAGSGKSVFVAQKMIAEAADKGLRVLVIRKVRNTCKLSTFKLFKDVFRSMGVSPKTNHTDLTFTFGSGGEILHGGMDDPEKIKSVASVNHIWIEEASELELPDIQQLDLRIRGKGRKQITYTFNPVPQSRTIFKYLNIDVDDLPNHARTTNVFNTFVRDEPRNVWYQHTTYLDNDFLDDAYKQALFAQDPAQFKIYAEGMLADEGAWDLVIQFAHVTAAMGKNVPGDKTYRMGVDPSEGVKGGDPSTLCVVEGGNLIRMERKMVSLADLEDHIIGIADEHGLDPRNADNIAVDGVGIGAGLISGLDRRGWQVTNVKAGRSPVDDNGFGGEDIEYQDVRTQMWWWARHLLQSGEVGIQISGEEVDLLRAELTAPRYKRVSEKKIQVEPKDSSGGLAAIRASGGFTWGVRQRLGRSTDCADAFIQALFVDYLKERSWFFDDTTYDMKAWSDPLAA